MIFTYNIIIWSHQEVNSSRFNSSLGQHFIFNLFPINSRYLISFLSSLFFFFFTMIFPSLLPPSRLYNLYKARGNWIIGNIAWGCYLVLNGSIYSYNFEFVWYKITFAVAHAAQTSKFRFRCLSCRSFVFVIRVSVIGDDLGNCKGEKNGDETSVIHDFLRDHRQQNLTPRTEVSFSVSSRVPLITKPTIRYRWSPLLIAPTAQIPLNSPFHFAFIERLVLRPCQFSWR